MKIKIEDIKEAYNRLKTHVYYDNNDLFIRRRIAEFETNLSSEDDILSVNSEYITKNKDGVFSKLEFTKSLEEKFKKITDSINNDTSFFDSFFNKMKIKYLPKKT